MFLGAWFSRAHFSIKERALGSGRPLALFLTLSFTLGACSPGMFFSNGKDPTVDETLGKNRTVNTACAGINLSSPELDAPTFRALVHCFNAYGALEPIEKLTLRLSNEELQPLLKATNRYLIDNTQALYQIEATYSALERKKKVEDTLIQLGHLLDNDEFVVQLVKVFKAGYESDKPSFLRALAHLGPRFSPEKSRGALEAGLNLTNAQAFSSLQFHFKSEVPSHVELQSLVNSFLVYLNQDSRDPKGYAQIGEELAQAIAHGGLLEAIDQVVGGTSSDAIQRGLPELSLVFKATSDHDGALLGGLSSLVHYIHQPVVCLKGAKVISDGANLLFDEAAAHDLSSVSDFVLRGQLMNLVVVNPFCDYPPQLGTYYPILETIAQSNTIQPMVKLIKGLHGASGSGGNRPLIDMLVSILGNTGSGTVSGIPEDSAGIKHLLPLLSEFQFHHAFDDLLLVLALPNEGDRKWLQDIASDLSEPVSELGGRSTIEVLSSAMGQAGASDLYGLLKSSQKYFDSDTPLLRPALTSLRSVYYLNDAHPANDILQKFLGDAPVNADVFDSVFALSKYPEFQDSVRWIVKMSQDGRLKDIVGTLLTIYDKHSRSGKTEIHALTEPVYTFSARHNLSQNDLNLLEYQNAPADPALDYGACTKLDTKIRMDQYDKPEFQAQIKNFAACFNYDHKHADFQDVIALFNSYQTEYHRSFLGFTIDLVKKLGARLDKGDIRYLLDSFLGGFDRKDLQSFLDMLPFFTTKATVHGDPKSSVLRPFMDLAKPLLAKTESLRRVLKFAADELEREDFTQILSYGEMISDRKPEPVTEPLQLTVDVERLKRWVKNKECQTLSGSDAQKDQQAALKVNDIVSTFENQVVTWTHDSETHLPITRWDFKEFQKQFTPVLDKFGDPNQGVPGRSPMQALLNFMSYHDPAELSRWIIRRANDLRAINYFYPGESEPRVRLVSGLDRYELVLINSDFTVPIVAPQNGALEAMEGVADAWGDEDPKDWPAEIKAKYSASHRPPTLAQAVDKLAKKVNFYANLSGLPKLPDCKQLANPNDPKEVQEAETTDPHGGVRLPFPLPGADVNEIRRKLFNISETISILQEDARDFSRDSGLKVFRNMFFELYYSTQPEYRNPKAGAHNNLNVFLIFTHMGFSHEIGRHSIGFKESDPAYIAMIDSVRRAARSPQVLKLLNPLLSEDPKHELIWSVLKQTWGISQAAEFHDPSELDDAHRKQILGRSASEVEELRRKWTHEVDLSKQIGFYFLAAFNDSKLIAQVCDALGTVLHRDYDYFVHHADKIQDALTWKDLSLFIRAFYEDSDQKSKDRLKSVIMDAVSAPEQYVATSAVDLLKAIDADPLAKDSLSTISDRYHEVVGNPDAIPAIPAMPGYRTPTWGANQETVYRALLHFLEARSSDPREKILTAKLRSYLASLMRNQDEHGNLGKPDLEEILRLAKDEPDRFYQLFEAAGHYSETREIEDFLAVIRRSFPESAR